MKFAAIDIGSNAVRLLLTRVFENEKPPLFKKESLVRMPIRLGDDAFGGGRISDDKADHLVSTMKAYRHLISAYEALDYAACATSAMREAANGTEIADRIRHEAGIELEIVDGRREAEIIVSNQARPFPGDESYLYIDVGGGSTEMTLFRSDASVEAHSINIGTLRILQDTVTDEHWHEMKRWLKHVRGEYGPTAAVGSGGNINKIFRMARQKDNTPLKYKKLKEIRKYLKSYTLDERITVLKLRPDRADVIVPAANIFVSALKWAGVRRLYVPQIGLSDGLVHILYDQYKAKTAGADIDTASGVTQKTSG